VIFNAKLILKELIVIIFNYYSFLYVLDQQFLTGIIFPRVYRAMVGDIFDGHNSGGCYWASTR
jgi:hypothetical protein